MKVKSESEVAQSCLTPSDPIDCSHTYTHTYTHTYIYMYTNIHTHTMEYCSVIKKNEIMSFVATWMQLETIILSEVSQTKTNAI